MVQETSEGDTLRTQVSLCQNVLQTWLLKMNKSEAKIKEAGVDSAPHKSGGTDSAPHKSGPGLSTKSLGSKN